tara:strand:+ start:2345 stop:2713 length:369 start_codon:yes stop_codon:yes gene_type:complete
MKADLQIEDSAAVILGLSRSQKRAHQVKVTLNDAELSTVDSLIGLHGSDRASIFRYLLCSYLRNEEEGGFRTTDSGSIDTDLQRDSRLPVAQLRELKMLFEEDLIMEDEYGVLRKRLLGIDG